MQVPAAMFIEAASDSIRSMPADFLQDQIRELQSFGDARAKQLGASGITNDITRGYELGLQTARMILQTNSTLFLKGIVARDVL